MEKKLQEMKENAELLDEEQLQPHLKKNKEYQAEKQLKINRKLDLYKSHLKKRVAKSIMSFNLRVDDEGFVYFNELVFVTLKRAYEPCLFNNILVNDELPKLKLLEEETKTLKTIHKNVSFFKKNNNIILPVIIF